MGKVVRFYQAEDGKIPVRDFLDSLPGKTAQKVAWVLMLAEELDILPATYFKKLVGSDDIWECRTQFGSNVYRILCFHVGAYKWIREENQEDTGEGNRACGSLQEGLSREAQAP